MGTEFQWSKRTKLWRAAYGVAPTVSHAVCRAQPLSPTLQLRGLCPPGSSVLGISQAGVLEWVPLPAPGSLPNPGIEPVSLASPALAGRFFITSTIWETPPYVF